MISRNERDLSIRKKSSRERSRPGTPYPAREVSMTVVNRSSTTVDDVSPWPQADRVNPTQGELAEERNRRSNHRFWRKCSDVSRMLSKTCNHCIAVLSVAEKGHDFLAVPVPSTALGYALAQPGQLQIIDFDRSRIALTR
jgi:hypothetical protein